MQKIINLFLFFTTFLYGQSQEIYGEMEYLTTLQIGSYVEANSILFFNSSKSCFIEGEFFNPSLKKNDIRVVYHDSISLNQIKYYTNLSKGKIFKHHRLKKKSYLVEEDIYPIKWELYNEYKSISGYKCQKAVGKFRGREYIAWFTTDIPIGLGPWKLNGLPGMILQAEDKNNQIHFFVKKITFLDSKSFNINLVQPKFNQSIVIPIKEYLKLIDKLEKEEFNKILASMPRGYKISSTKITGRESKMEISYEWEDIIKK